MSAIGFLVLLILAIALLMALSAFVTFNDIMKLVK